MVYFMNYLNKEFWLNSASFPLSLLIYSMCYMYMNCIMETINYHYIKTSFTCSLIFVLIVFSEVDVLHWIGFCLLSLCGSSLISVARSR